MHPQPFDDPDLNDDEDDAVPFAFSKIRLGLGRRVQSERHLSRPLEPFHKASLACEVKAEAEAPRVSATAAPSAKEQQDACSEPFPAGASKVEPWTAVISSKEDDTTLDRTGSDHAKILKNSKELLNVYQKDGEAQPTGSGSPPEVVEGRDSSAPSSHKIATLLQAAMDGGDAGSATVTSNAERDDQKENELKVLALREFTRSLSQRAVARTSFRRQGSSMSISSESGSVVSVVSADGEAAHASKKKRRSRKITRSHSMIDVMPVSAPEPGRVAIEYDFDDTGMDASAAMRRFQDPDGADPVRSPIKRSRSLHRSSSAVPSGHTLSKSLHLPEPSRGRQVKSPPSASKEGRRSVQRSRSLQPKSRGEAPVPEQQPSTTRKPVRRSTSSESLSSLSNRSQLSMKRDLIGVLSCSLDGSTPIVQPVTTSSPKQESERPPPSRTLQRAKSIQPTNRPKIDPPGVLSTASYLPSEHPHLNSRASEQPVEARQLVTPPSIPAEKESTRKVKRSQSLQLTKRPHPAPIGAIFPTSEKAKGKAAKSKRGHGSVSFVESPFPLELDGVERIKSHSSSSSRTSCSTAGTTTSSSQSNDDYGDDDIEGAADAGADASAAVLKPLTA